MKYYRPNTSKAGKEYKPTKTVEAESFYRSKTWTTLSRLFRANNPLCAICSSPASIVHHIVPIQQDASISLLETNLESLCSKCHNALHKGKK